MGILREEGPGQLFRVGTSYLLGFVRPYAPYIMSEYNSVAVPRHRVIDILDPTVDCNDRPEYEGTIISAIQEKVSEGDTVVILGGGVGVATVHAGQMAGGIGEVHVYEASKEMIEIHERVLSANRVPADVSLNHATVGESGIVWGQESTGDVIPPSSLPDGDVFVIDIEGAEANVVPELPTVEVLIVETHGTYGSSTDEIHDQLISMGYYVVDAGVAEPKLAREHEEKDVRVLVATRDG